MKKLSFILSYCALTLSATAASAAGVYVGGNIGFAVPPSLELTTAYGWEVAAADIEFDTGWALNGAVGYDFDGFRVEGEIGYQHNKSGNTDFSLSGYDYRATISTTDILNAKLKTVTYMANGYYDFKNSSPWTPFLGAGIGAATVKLDDISFAYDYGNYSYDDTVFAYQLMAGVSYAVSKNLALDLSYRFVGTESPEFDDGWGNAMDFEFYSHNFLLGARYTF